jgi:predicted sulfurtransferase
MTILYPKVLLGLLITAALLGVGLAPSALAADVPLMTKDELKAVLGDADLVILDARAGKDWKSSEFKIKGAIRAAPGEFDEWGSTYDKGKKIVLYCA